MGCNNVPFYHPESLIKIIGLRQYYFTVPWNLFDFVLVVASIVDLAVGDYASLPIPPTMLRIVRVFRIGRVLRLIKVSASFSTLEKDLKVSICRQLKEFVSFCLLSSSHFQLCSILEPCLL